MPMPLCALQITCRGRALIGGALEIAAMSKFASSARSSVRPRSLAGLVGIFWTDRYKKVRQAAKAVLGLGLLLVAAPVAGPVAASVAAPVAAPVVATQDINGDGRVDAVFTQKQRYNQVCFGNGTGAFTTCTDLIGAGQFQLSNQINTTASALLDWDADGDLDIALAMEGHSSVVCYNDGAGQFNSGLGCVELYGFNSYPFNAQGVAAGDLDGDGRDDLVFANGGNAGLPLDQPSFVCLATTGCYEFGGSAASTGVALGDVDNDGDIDVLVSNSGSQNEVCLNYGNGRLYDCRLITQAGNVLATKSSNAVAVGHLPPGFGATPDEWLDVVFGNTGRNERCFGDGNWSGSNVGFTCAGYNAVTSYTTTDANARTTGVTIADFTPTVAGLEIAFANADAPNTYCMGTFTCGTQFNERETVNVNIGGTIYAVSEPIIEATMGVAIRDINIDGKLDVVVANMGMTAGVSRTYIGPGFSPSVVANSAFQPTSVTLSGGTVGPSADTEPPTFVGATNRTAEATGPTGAIVTYTVTAVDIQDGSRPITCAPASGTLFPIGGTTVTCASSDTSGNAGTATFVVTVRDTTGPVVTVPSNISVLATPGQPTTAVTWVTSALDAVNGVITDVTCYNTATNFGVLSGSQFPGGTMNLRCMAYDGSHNEGHADFSVTVTTDVDSDGILDNVDLDDDADGIADTLDTEPVVASNAFDFDGTNTGTVTRNGWTVAVTALSSGSTYAIRATVTGTGTAPAVIRADCSNSRRKELRLDTAGETVEWRCDASSLTVNFVSGAAEFWKVTWGWTRIMPTAANTTVTAGSPVTADPTNTAPVAVTIFDENLMEIGSFSLDPGESVGVDFVDVGGEFTLQLEVLNGGTDGLVSVTLFGQPVALQQGNGPTTFDITPDVTAPVITAQISGTLGNNGFYTSDVTVTWTVTDAESAATSTGCAAQSVTQDTTGVTFTCVAQSEGGSASQSVTITRDATAPVITVPADITTVALSAAGAVVTYTATVQDVIDATTSVACVPASGSTFAIGSTTVTCTAADAAGNAASSTFMVSVTNTAPTFTAPANRTVEATSAAGAAVTYTASGTDAEEGPIAAVCAPASGATFPLGSTIVNCTVTDRVGAAVSASFTVNVVDTIAPSIATTTNISAAATSAAGAVVTYTAPATTDAVSGPGVAVCAPASGSTFAVGTTTVTCTAADAAGNTSSRSFGVTVSTVVTTPGHMRGEGSVRDDGTRYEFDFDVEEGRRGERASFKLEVKDERGKGRGRERDNRRDDREDKFVARSVTSVVFSDDPTDRPGRGRRPQVDSVLFSGTGTWNGVSGYTYQVFAEDRGEGRHRESVRITIRNSSGAIVAFVEGEVSGGSIRSARVKH